MGNAIGQMAKTGLGMAASQSPFLSALSQLGQGKGIGATPGGGTPAFQPKVETPGVGPAFQPIDPSSNVAAANIATLPPAPTATQQSAQQPTHKGQRRYEGMARQAAQKWGIDPDTAVRVLNAEGGLDDWIQSKVKKNGVREPSYGPGQFLIGGAGTGFPEGLGNRFIKDTGLDPRDASNAAPYFDYMMKEVSQRGWGQWYGAKAAGVGNFAGVGGRPSGHSPQLDMVQGGAPYTPDAQPTLRPLQSRMFGDDMTPGQGEAAQKTAFMADAAAQQGGRSGGSMGVQQAEEADAAPAVDLGAEEVAANSQALQSRVKSQPSSRAEMRKADLRRRTSRGGQA